MVNLDELQAKWAAHNKDLETLTRLNHQMLAAPKLNRSQSAFKRALVGIAIEVGLTFLLVMFLGDFIYEHWNLGSLMVPVAAFDIMMIWALGSQIRHLIFAQRIDFSAPVTVLQRDLMDLRSRRLRYGKIVFLLGFMAWFWLPFGLIALQKFPPAGWLGFQRACFVSSLVALLLLSTGVSVWLAKWFDERRDRFPRLQRLTGVLAGRSLNAAVEAIAELKEFEQEPVER